MSGTTVDVVVDRVVDGDTIRVFLAEGEDGTRSDSVRILALDTEEVHSSGGKPVTPLGRRASERAKELIRPGDTVRLVLPGNEPRDEALRKHRGNFGRPLVYVELEDGRDFQEIVIREGLSPYFVKYGYAHFSLRHARYQAAERAAQAEHLGVWDQITHNGSAFRNYAALTTWWDLRARIIEGYREVKRRAPEANLFNTRLDYDKLVEIARARETTTVFMELRSFSPVGADHVAFRTGSTEQPFQLFVPNGNAGEGADVLQLLQSRYVSEGEAHPRRSYAYVTGPTKLFPDDASGRPEIVVTDPAQVTDWPAAAIERAVATAI